MQNMNEFLRQAQLLQRKVQKAQEQLGEKVFEASSGGGMVKAVVNGNMRLVSLEIDPSVYEGGDREMLQDLILAAVNEAERIAQETREREVSTLTSGIKIPGLF